MDIVTTIQDYITRELVKNKSHIDPDESLIGSGLLDSLTLLQLIAFLEDEFGVKVESSDMAPENFQTLNAMKTFLEQKMASK